MLKKYPVIESAVHMLQENDICHLVLAFVIIHNIGIDAGDVKDIEKEEGIDKADENREGPCGRENAVL